MRSYEALDGRELRHAFAVAAAALALGTVCAAFAAARYSSVFTSHNAITIGLSLAAGLHAALHGAWKDSPSEGFKVVSFLRELLIGTGVGIALCQRDSVISPFLTFLSAYALNRIVFEFYKMFVRTVPQEAYRIPTQIHWMGRVVTNPGLRLLLGCGYLGAIYGLICLLELLPAHWPRSITGAIAGVAFGTATAAGGGYKDGSVTGFRIRKFCRSPINGALGGLIVSIHQGSMPALALGAVACERMLTELMYKMLNPRYVGGHFHSTEAAFPEWIIRRRVFVVPYAATWALFVALWIGGS